MSGRQQESHDVRHPAYNASVGCCRQLLACCCCAHLVPLTERYCLPRNRRCIRTQRRQQYPQVLERHLKVTPAAQEVLREEKNAQAATGRQRGSMWGRGLPLSHTCPQEKVPSLLNVVPSLLSSILCDRITTTGELRPCTLLQHMRLAGAAPKQNAYGMLLVCLPGCC